MCYINANNSPSFCTSVGLSSGDFKVPTTGRHYCSITLTLIVPRWGARSLSSLLPALREAGQQASSRWPVVGEEEQPQGLGERYPCTQPRNWWSSLWGLDSHVFREKGFHRGALKTHTKQCLPGHSVCFSWGGLHQAAPHRKRSVSACWLTEVLDAEGVCHYLSASVVMGLRQEGLQDLNAVLSPIHTHFRLDPYHLL